MGVYWTYYAGVGVQIDWNKVPTTATIINSCEHPERIGQTFCPKCGKKVGTRTEAIEEFDWYDLVLAFEDVMRERGEHWKLVPIGYESRKHFLGWAQALSHDDDEPKSLEEMPDNDTAMTVISEIVATCQAEFPGIELTSLFVNPMAERIFFNWAG